MRDAGSSLKIVRFGDFEADLKAGCLFTRGVKIRLREKVSVALSVLLERAGEVVSREELQKRLWPGDVVVDFELNLNTVIAKLREALGDSAENPRYIETLPKRGYRFLAPLCQGFACEPSLRRRIRLVVLPFLNLSGQPAEEYFSDSMAEEIITQLGKVAPEHLGVIARTTAMHYKGMKKDVARISRELGLDYVVEGGVRRDGDRVAVNVQLVETAGQTQVFAGKYEAEMSDLFGLHIRIAQDIAAQIPAIPMLRAVGHAGKKPTQDLPAYQLFLQGRQHMYKMTPDSLAKARKCFEDAIARDSRFALAYDALGESYWWTGFFGFLPPKQASFAGLGALLRAVEIDPSLGETHALLGQFRQKVDYNWPEVLREMSQALEMDPSSPLVRYRYAVSYLLPQGRLEEAIGQVECGLEFDPLSWPLNLWLSTFLWLNREHDRAMSASHVFEGLDPVNFAPAYIMANIYRDSGRLEEAVLHQRRAVALAGGSPQMLGWLGLNLALAGNTDEARSVLQRIQAIAARTYVSPSCFVWVHVGLGEFDEALAWLDRAIDERDSYIIPIKTYPLLDPLRSDPRFQALVRKMNLEP